MARPWRAHHDLQAVQHGTGLSNNARGCPGSEMRPEYGEQIPIPTNATTLANPGGEGYSIFDQGNWDPACLTDEACEPEMENIT